MLPEEISNKLCSLRPKEKKACLVCKVELDKKGKLKEASFFEAIVNFLEVLYRPAGKWSEGAGRAKAQVRGHSEN